MIDIRISNFGLRFGELNDKYEFVRYHGSDDLHHVIAFFDETSEGYDMRTVGSRFFKYREAFDIGSMFLQVLDQYKALKEDMEKC